MDFDEYDYLEKEVEDPKSSKVSGKKEGVEKIEGGYRRRKDDGDEDRVSESRNKRSRADGDNGEIRERDDGERSSRSERRDKDQHRNGRDVEREYGRDRFRARERDRERSTREREERGRERGWDREKEKEKEMEREREKGRVRDRERPRRSSSPSRRHQTDHDRDVEGELGRIRGRDRGPREREYGGEMRENRRVKEKKEVEPEPDPEREQRTVFAQQMPLKATERDVFEFFSNAGKVRNVKLIMDRNSRRSKGVGYVEFHDSMSVPMAIALSGHLLLGQPIVVKPSEAEKNHNHANASSGGSGGLAGPYGAGARKLYIGNLHFNMTEDQLRQVFEPFGPVELVQLPLDLETGQCKGFGFVQFVQLEDAKAAQSLNGKLEIAGRVIKVSAVTDHVALQDVGANAADFNDDDGGGLSLNAKSRAMLMQKLDRTGTVLSIAGSLGVPMLNESAPNQHLVGPHMNIQAASHASALPVQVVNSSTIEPIGNPSECLLLKNMFDPTTEMDPDFDMDIKDEVQEECSKFGPLKHIYVDKKSAGYVFLRFETVAAAFSTQRAMHMRWFARRLVSAVFLESNDYEAKCGGLN